MLFGGPQWSGLKTIRTSTLSVASEESECASAYSSVYFTHLTTKD
uniref:Uncharacterized protein n=1 Tax=Arundo donax TaxID=35708 RepID=A0A0A9F1L1_ARUDO